MPDADTHSHIGASSAYRWMACPGSVRLCAAVPKRTTAYASEGSAAHALCERCLRDGSDPAEHFGEVIAADGSEFTVDEKMVAAVTVYVDKVRGDLKKFGGRLNIEKSFDLSWLYPGMFGRNDSSIEPDGVFGTLRVYDYKNGKKPVFAEANSQCMYYALGALGEKNPYCVDRVEVTIIQQNAVEIIDRVPPGEGVGEIPADTIRMRQPRIADDPAVRQRSFAEFRTRGKSIAEELRLLIRNGENVDFEFGIRLRKELFTRKILHETVCLKRSLPAELKRSERRPQQSFSLNRRAKPERPVRGKGNLRFFPGLQTIRGAVDHTVHAHFSGLQTVEDESVSGEKVRFRVRHIAVQRLPVRHEGGDEVERAIGIELRMIDALAGDEAGMAVDFRE